MELSIVIVSFNVKDYLRQCLNSVYGASEKIDSEIFVVDNNSNDGSEGMIKNEFPEVRLIVNDFNAGFSVANNQALRLASGKYTLILNPDTILSKDTLHKCICFMNEHEDAGAMGVRMINGDNIFLRESVRAIPSPRVAFFKAFGFSSLFPGSQFFSNYYLPKVNNTSTSQTEIISGAFMFIRMEALAKSGLFDEDFFMYGEDIDLSYRLLQTGYKNYYSPEIQIIHFKGKSLIRNSYKDVIFFYESMRIYLKKRYLEGKYRWLYPMLILGIYLREALALTNRFLRLTLSKKGN